MARKPSRRRAEDADRRRQRRPPATAAPCGRSQHRAHGTHSALSESASTAWYKPRTGDLRPVHDATACYRIEHSLCPSRSLLREPTVYRPPSGFPTTRCSAPAAFRATTPAALVAELEQSRAGAARRPPAGAATRSSCSRASPSTPPARRARSRTGRSRSTSSRGSSRRPSGPHIKRGLAQRIRALNHFVDDVYHGREIVREGLIPWRLVVSRIALRPGRPRHPATGWRLLPRRRLRPRQGRRRVLEGPRGQRPHPVGDLLRPGEPRRDDAAGPPALPALPRPAGRPLPAAAAGGAARGRAERRRGGDGRRLEPGPAQLRLLRARLPRAPDGRRARRGLRPGRPRRRALHAHDLRAAARARRLPPPGRRLRRSARVPPRLAARRPRAGACLPRGHGRDRQRVRHGCRRRQGDLPLRPGDDPLLPRRGADPQQRRDAT